MLTVHSEIDGYLCPVNHCMKHKMERSPVQRAALSEAGWAILS